jgi:hypothetical protein
MRSWSQLGFTNLLNRNSLEFASCILSVSAKHTATDPSSAWKPTKGRARPGLAGINPEKTMVLTIDNIVRGLLFGSANNAPIAMRCMTISSLQHGPLFMRPARSSA